MSDKRHGNVKAGVTSLTTYFMLRKTSDSTEQTGKVYSDFTGSYVRTGGSRTAITMATQTVTGAYSSGGCVEVDATNIPGLYRFDPPDACFASGVESVIIALKCTGCFVEPWEYAIETVGAAELSARIPTALTTDGNIKADALRLGGTTQTGRDIGASVLLSSGTGTGQLKLASGYVAMTWADVAAPTTSVNLSGTTIATTQKVDVETIKTNPVVNGGTLTFPTNATVASTTNITAGTIATVTTLTNLPAITANWLTATGIATGAITAAKFAAGAIDAAAIATDAIDADALKADAATEIATAVRDIDNTTPAADSLGESINSAASAGDPWGTSLPGAYSAGTAGYIVGTNINDTITSRMATYSQPTGFLAATFPSGTIANTTNITAGTVTTATNVTTVNGLAANVLTATSIASDAITAAKVASDVGPEFALAFLKYDFTGITGEASRSVLNSLRFVRNGFTISGSTMTILKEDDSSAAYTRTLTSDAAADPVTGVGA